MSKIFKETKRIPVMGILTPNKFKLVFAIVVFLWIAGTVYFLDPFLPQNIFPKGPGGEVRYYDPMLYLKLLPTIIFGVVHGIFGVFGLTIIGFSASLVFLLLIIYLISCFLAAVLRKS